MRDAIAAAQKRPEHDAEEILVGHVLIAFQGTLKDKPVLRSRDQAEVLAAEVFRQVRAGAEFELLVKSYSDDTFASEYRMTKATRASMVASFGNVGWRLKVGEFGVAPFHATDSPYGWHIIKRLE